MLVELKTTAKPASLASLTRVAGQAGVTGQEPGQSQPLGVGDHHTVNPHG
jgi:hypothetical protein